MTEAARTADPPVVSVVIPTRNRRQRLCVALRSALAQQAVDLEVVVVDDGSQDDTSEMVMGLADPRIRLLRNESPQGESGARNRGIAEARGTWVAFLDDDDLWAPHKLSRQLQALLESGRDWAYTGEVMVDSDFRILTGAPPPPPGEVMQSLERHNSVPAGASNVIVNSKLLSRVGPFDKELKRTADWDMWLRLARMGPPGWVCSPLVAICIHSGNMSRDMARHVSRAGRARSSVWNSRRPGTALSLGGVDRVARRPAMASRSILCAGSSGRGCSLARPCRYRCDPTAIHSHAYANE